MVVFSGGMSSAWGRDYFDPSFLSIGATKGASAPVDLSQFEQAGNVPAGKYLVDIYVNGEQVDSRTLVFAPVPGGATGEVYPELTVGLLDRYGVNVAAIEKLKALPPDATLGPIAQLIPSAKTTFDFATLRLNISMPQAYLKPNSGGVVDPSLWDEGVPAFLMNYNLSGGNRWQDGQSGNGNSRQDGLFASFHSGLNWGAWRLRNDTTYYSTRVQTQGEETNKSTAQKWSFLNTYLQRDIAPLKSELTLGDSNTGGDVFDGIPFRGVQMATNDEMTPDSQRGFAPVITGIASSNAKVTITQNNAVIYQTYVAPGPFRLTDVQQSQAGDMVITVTEANGTQHSTTQAYSSVPIMQREGHAEYELTAGRYRGMGVTDGQREPMFALGTLIYGLPHGITLYGGGLGANDYQSVVVGSGLSLGVMGAISLDATLARAKLPGQEDAQTGSSYRIKYSKSMLTTGTTFDLAAYRYSTRNYYSFSDTNNMGYRLYDNQVPWLLDRRRSSWQIRLSQQLDGWGSIYVSGMRDDFWGNNRINNNLSAGYSGSYQGITYGLSYGISRVRGQGEWPENRQIAFTLQVPLSRFNASASSSTFANYAVTHDNSGRTQNQVGVSGSTMDNALSYGVMQGIENQGRGNSGSLYGGYRGGMGNMTLGYNYSQGTRGVNYGLSGGVLVHPYGVTLGQQMGDTLGLVRAPGASGMKVTTGSQVVTNPWGYAVVPNLSAYRANRISLDPSTLPANAEVLENSQRVYPTKGAVVVANYKVRVGEQVMLTLLYRGKPVPFGATASLEGDRQAEAASIVGDAGLVYLSGMPSQGTVHVKWGNGADQQCSVALELGKPDAEGNMKQVRAVCQ
ncbi:fimbria/pilus outer membrane usher protein [Serratia fonticola]|uniref:fimbria/pilus outer membrane usher protein n=1 Tax=Serratia fonticola TaxID=47917 RepID=UPI00301D579B